jgi:hypothetical protein
MKLLFFKKIKKVQNFLNSKKFKSSKKFFKNFELFDFLKIS